MTCETSYAWWGMKEARRSRLKGINITLLFFGMMMIHIGVSCFFYEISIHRYFSTLHYGNGIWKFALDSNSYHNDAVELLSAIREKGWSEWWHHSPRFWHAKYIALMYWFLKPVPLSMEPLNALLWSSNFILVFYISSCLLTDEKLSLIVASLFSFFPSYFMTTIQLMKDPFYILGVLLYLAVWVWLWSRYEGDRCVRTISFLVVAIGVGFYVIINTRMYLRTVWMGITLLFYLFSLLRKPKQWRIATLFFAIPLLIFVTTKAPIKLIGQVKPIYPLVYSKWIPDGLEAKIIQLARSREGFCRGYPNAGSNIDTSVRFHSVSDIVRYLPRASEIGLFAPFPYFWFQKAKISGRISRLIVGGEMLILYLLYAGIVGWLINKSPRIEDIVSLLWGMGMILLFSLVVTNLGTLHRMRHIYLLPVFIYGTAGLNYIWESFKKPH